VLVVVDVEVDALAAGLSDVVVAALLFVVEVLLFAGFAADALALGEELELCPKQMPEMPSERKAINAKLNCLVMVMISVCSS
jgi:hypothetical protein